MSRAAHSCASCGRNILDRTLEQCSYCGHPVPLEAQATEAEREAMAERERRRKKSKAADDGFWEKRDKKIIRGHGGL